MKILLLNYTYFGDGTYWRVFYIGKHLSELGHEVTMICPSDRDFYLRISKEQINKNFLRITLPRIKYTRYYTGQEFRFILNILQVLLYQYEIIHCFTVAQPQIGIPGLFSKMLRRKKLIVDWDDLWKGGFADYQPYNVRKILEICETNITKFADKITVISEFLKKMTLNLGIEKEKIVKIPNGANTDVIKPLDKTKCRQKLNLDSSPTIVSMGHTYTESLDFLLDSFKKVIEQIPETKLLMIGRINLPKGTKNKLEKLPNNIILTGEQPFKKIPLYLSAADVLVLPMANNVIERARLPFRLGDYLASGRAIVSNAVGETKRILAQNRCGLISPPEDIISFSENIVYLLTNAKVRENLGKKGRKVAETKFSWKQIAKNLEGVYKF